MRKVGEVKMATSSSENPWDLENGRTVPLRPPQSTVPPGPNPWAPVAARTVLMGSRQPGAASQQTGDAEPSRVSFSPARRLTSVESSLPASSEPSVTPPDTELVQKPAPARLQLNKLVVSTYKVMGFAVLTVIVGGLLSYMATNLFYFVNTSWTQPTVISPTDDRVLQLSAQHAEQSSQRDKLVAELADAERIVQMQDEFQKSFKAAVSADLDDRRTQLVRLARLERTYADTRAQIRRSSQAYAGMSRQRIDEQFKAQLIDRDAMVNGNYQLSQIATSNLSLAEREVEVDTRKRALARESEALSTTLTNQGAGGLSYDVLKIRQDMRRGELEAAKARDNRDALKAAIVRYDHMLSAIAGSPYLRAADHKATVAFVPYDNLASVPQGAKLYGCALGMLWCHEVGKVLSLLPGEVQMKHPLHNQTLRGQMVEVELSNPSWAEAKVLFARRSPLFL